MTSVTSSSLLTLFHGARKEYHEASDFYLSNNGSIKYPLDSKDERPFPVPSIMVSSDTKSYSNEIIQANFFDGSVQLSLLLSLLRFLMSKKTSLAIVSVLDSNHTSFPPKISLAIRELCHLHDIQIYVFGQTVTCDLLYMVNKVPDSYTFLPTIIAKESIDLTSNDLLKKFLP